MSRFRRRLEAGDTPAAAAHRTTAELTPIILTCGLAVAAACAALVVADLGFLQAFGPGMAMAILVALAVSMTFIPATLALLGERLFWPHVPAPAGRAAANSTATPDHTPRRCDRGSCAAADDRRMRDRAGDDVLGPGLA